MKLKIGMFALVAVSMLSGCASTATTYANLNGYRQHVGALVGQSTDELQIQLGPPDSISALPEGRTKWTYLKTWKYPGTSEVVTGKTTETRAESYKDANGKMQWRDVTYDVPILSPPGVETAGCETTFVIGPNKIVESYEIPRRRPFLGISGSNCTYYENPKKTD